MVIGLAPFLWPGAQGQAVCYSPARSSQAVLALDVIPGASDNPVFEADQVISQPPGIKQKVKLSLSQPRSTSQEDAIPPGPSQRASSRNQAHQPSMLDRLGPRSEVRQPCLLLTLAASRHELLPVLAVCDRL